MFPRRRGATFPRPSPPWTSTERSTTTTAALSASRSRSADPSPGAIRPPTTRQPRPCSYRLVESHSLTALPPGRTPHRSRYITRYQLTSSRPICPAAIDGTTTIDVTEVLRPHLTSTNPGTQTVGVPFDGHSNGHRPVRQHRDGVHRHSSSRLLWVPPRAPTARRPPSEHRWTSRR